MRDVYSRKRVHTRVYAYAVCVVVILVGCDAQSPLASYETRIRFFLYLQQGAGLAFSRLVCAGESGRVNEGRAGLKFYSSRY